MRIIAISREVGKILVNRDEGSNISTGVQSAAMKEIPFTNTFRGKYRGLDKPCEKKLDFIEVRGKQGREPIHLLIGCVHDLSKYFMSPLG